MAKRRRTSTGTVRITSTGLGYVVVCIMVAMAGTNSGNNALFIVLALMLACLALSGFTSRWNVRGLKVRLEAPSEVFARRPFTLNFEVLNSSRWLPRWFLLVSAERREQARLISFLPPGGRSLGGLECLQPKRGRHSIPYLGVSSPFPFGFFFKGRRYRVDLDLLVYPELFGADEPRTDGAGELGERGGPKPGRGHELRQLRAFQSGDDPRSVHWKQTAKTGSMIFMEREEEQGRRVSVLLDNGTGELDEEKEERFERLVSEAATVATDFLRRGFEVELVTRDKHLTFASGSRHCYAVWEALALVEPKEPESSPLESMDPRAPKVRLALDTGSGADS